MTIEDQQLNASPVDEQAAYWLCVLRDEPTPERQAAFLKWVNALPRNVTEFALAEAVDNQLRRFHRARHIDVDALIERSKQEQQSNRRRAWTVRIAASIAAIGLLLSAGIVILHRTPEAYVTMDEQQLIDLEDGSVVALNARSEMRVAFSANARDLYLGRGQGIFRVRHDAKRPFRVHAGTTVVEAVGTQFDVRVAGDQTIVAVLEGVVQLKPGSSTMRAGEEKSTPVEIPRVMAGQSATIRQEGAEEIKAIDVAAATAWRRPTEQLEFQDQPLAEIAGEFNRHNAAPKLRIEGDELRERRFILVFTNASPQSLLNYLSQDDALEFVQKGDDIVIRERNY